MVLQLCERKLLRLLIWLNFLSNIRCRYSGIPCITVVGYAKGIEFRPGMQFQDRRLNHSWNVIFVDDAWQLVDSHWATRYELILFTHRQSVLVLDQNVNRSVIGSQHSCVLCCSWPKILHIPSSFPSFFAGNNQLPMHCLFYQRQSIDCHLVL